MLAQEGGSGRERKNERWKLKLKLHFFWFCLCSVFYLYFCMFLLVSRWWWCLLPCHSKPAFLFDLIFSLLKHCRSFWVDFILLLGFVFFFSRARGQKKNLCHGAHCTFILVMMTMATNTLEMWIHEKEWAREKESEKTTNFLRNADVPTEKKIVKQTQEPRYFGKGTPEINVYTTNRRMMAINLVLAKHTTTTTTTKCQTKGALLVSRFNQVKRLLRYFLALFSGVRFFLRSHFYRICQRRLCNFCAIRWESGIVY